MYCVAKNLVANEKVFVYLSKADIEKVRNASKAGDSKYSPWNTWYEEMAKKTAIKRMCKLLPLSVEEQKRIAQDETIKTELHEDMSVVKDETVWDGDTIDTPVATERAAGDSEVPRDEETSPSEKPAMPTGPVISEAQRKRLYAIAKSEGGYSDEEFKQHLSWNFNFDSSKDVTKDKYDDVCKYFSQKRS